MKRQLLSGLSALALTLLPLAAGTAAFTLAGAEAALAGGGNGHGNGGGNGHGRGNGGGHGRGHSADADDDGDDEDDDGPGHGNGNGRGAIASELRGLNACHASATARENAAEGSQVGRIAAYQGAQETAATAQGEAAAAQAAYEQLDANKPARDAAAVTEQILAVDPEDDGIANMLDTDGDGDGDIEGDQAALDALRAERDAAAAYETDLAAALKLRDDTATAATTAAGAANEALLVASNGRELSPEAQAALDECLAD